ncbi:MAG: tyrosine--tRNA ligase [Candidatus Diapherotrites archaeon]
MVVLELEEKIGLVKRNSVEVIEEAELRKLLEEKQRPITYCGYEPSGEIHLGHMVTVTKLKDLEKAGFKVKVLFADWHAWLNKKGDWNFIHEQVKLWEKAFRSLGLKNAEYVLGTDFQRSTEYINDLMTLSLHTTVNRGMRAMQEVARDIEHAAVSQMIYPLMQVNDIKHLKVDLAQAGIEQRKIHMLARENLELIGCKKPVLVHTPLVESLLGPGKKMSSSEPNSLISVRDSQEQVQQKLKKAWCEEGVVQGNPVLQVLKLVVMPQLSELKVERAEKFGGPITFTSYEEAEKAFAEKKLHPMDLKAAVAQSLSEMLEPVRKVFGE